MKKKKYTHIDLLASKANPTQSQLQVRWRGLKAKEKKEKKKKKRRNQSKSFLVHRLPCKFPKLDFMDFVVNYLALYYKIKYLISSYVIIFVYEHVKCNSQGLSLS